ncbi:sulfotransferase family protein [Rubrobacter tropicus]|nr:sulfotransferase [Rubrobacter tropicus]
MTEQQEFSTRTSGTGLEPHHFIVGCARSGTTLLHRIVDAHPLVAVTPEMHWISKHLETDAAGGPIVTPRTVSELADHRRFSHFDLDRPDFEALLGMEESLPYREFLRRLFGLYGRSKDKPVVGNKTPAYVRHLPELHGLWPRSRFVHIIRDGRDVCLSVLNWKKAARTAGRYATWEEDPVTTTALWWERKVRSGHEDGAALGRDLYHEMLYEDLIGAPEAQCRALCDFLALPYDPAMVRFSEGKTRTDLPDARRTPKKAWLPVTSGLRDWRTQMEADDVERFEAAVGDLLTDLGYERAFPDPGREALANARRVREAFERDIGARRERP